MSESPGPESDQNQPNDDRSKRVLVTGATGFVGRYVVRELVLRGYIPVCLVRSRASLTAVTKDLDQSRISGVDGSLFDEKALQEAADRCGAAIHIVGIILEDPFRGQTFDRIHRQGTLSVINAVKEAGIRRYIHMSALGSRPDAIAVYHQTKYEAEEAVKRAGLDWTIFQPSIIHGHDGEFMQLLKAFACGLIPPVMPYFGSGENRLQPVSVKDVAHCFVSALEMSETIGKTYEMGGPRAYSWKELYATAKRLMPGSKKWKPMVSQPVPVAKLIASTVMKTPLVPKQFKFNVGQVQMSQEDSVCDVGAVESTFGIKMRNFEDELSRYADLL